MRQRNLAPDSHVSPISFSLTDHRLMRDTTGCRGRRTSEQNERTDDEDNFRQRLLLTHYLIYRRLIPHLLSSLSSILQTPENSFPVSFCVSLSPRTALCTSVQFVFPPEFVDACDSRMQRRTRVCLCLSVADDSVPRLPSSSRDNQRSPALVTLCVLSCSFSDCHALPLLLLLFGRGFDCKCNNCRRFSFFPSSLTHRLTGRGSPFTPCLAHRHRDLLSLSRLADRMFALISSRLEFALPTHTHKH